MLSVVWLVVAFLIERHVVYDPIYRSYDHCVDRTFDWSICDKTMDDAIVEARKAEPITFADVALFPTLAITWIRRGRTYERSNP